MPSCSPRAPTARAGAPTAPNTRPANARCVSRIISVTPPAAWAASSPSARASLTTAPSSHDAVARDGARDDEPLDLRRALEDRVDLRVAVPALDRVLAGVAVAAEDL